MTRRARTVGGIAVLSAILYLAFLIADAEINEKELYPSYVFWRIALATHLISANDIINGAPLITKVMDGDSYPVESAKILLEYGADINAKGSDSPYDWEPGGWTALLVAVDRHFVEGTRFLLQHGADANAELQDGSTALSFLSGVGALADPDMTLAQLLVKAGADTCHRDHHDQPTWKKIPPGAPLRKFLEEQCAISKRR